MPRRLASLILSALVCSALSLLFAFGVFAPLSAAALTPMPAEVWVCPSGECGAPNVWQNFSNLQSAVLGVNDGGIVHVAEGSYLGGATIYRNLTIDGSGQSATVVQGTSRVFTITLGTVVLSDLTITGGTHDYEGGGVWVSPLATATLSHCDVTDNRAEMAGGGIMNYGRLTLFGCDVVENDVGGFGGGLANAGHAFITNTQFLSNSSQYLGGGLANGFEGEGTLATLDNVTFSGNGVEAAGSMGDGIPGGGGIVNGARAILKGAAVEFLENSAYWDTLEGPGFAAGGGLYNFLGGHAVLVDVYCRGNEANKGGCAANLNEYYGEPDERPGASTDMRAWGMPSPQDGDVRIARPMPDFGPSWLTMTNASIFSNTALECGGGILNTYWIWPDAAPPEDSTANLDANLVLVTATLSHNTAGLLGGGISNGSNTSGVNVWLGGNHAGLGGGVSSSSGSVLSLLWFLLSVDSGSPPDMAVLHSLQDQNVAAALPQQIPYLPYGPVGQLTMSNAVFTGNESHGIEELGGLPVGVMQGAGGGLFNLLSDARLTNATLSGNRALTDTVATESGAIMSFEGALTLTNCIVGDSGFWPILVYEDEPPTTTITYSDIEGGWPGAGNIDDDPEFVDADGADDEVGTLDDDLRLGPGSPAIDAGLDAAVPADKLDVDGDADQLEQLPIDLDGNPRFVGTVDMGAYEAVFSTGLEISKADLSDPVPATWRIYYTIRVTNTTGALLDPVVITDTLPAGTYFVSADLGGVGSYGSPVVVWEVVLDPHQTLNLHVVLGSFSTLSGVISNQATVSSPGAGFAETSESTTITAEPPRPPTPTPTPTPMPTVTPVPPATVGDSLDTYIYRYAPDANYWLAPLLKVGFKQTNASLIRFDLSDMPPVGSVMDEAWLEVYAAGWSGLGSDITIGAYAISTTMVVSQTTWNEAYAGDAWQGFGCADVVWDRRPLAEATVTTAGPLRWYRFDVAALLQDWVDGAPVNNGVLLKQETTTPYAFFFASQEYPNPLLHPRLVLRYH